jgi:hypothetical protein
MTGNENHRSCTLNNVVKRNDHNNDVNSNNNNNNNYNDNDNGLEVNVIHDSQQLLRHGVCRARLPSTWNERLLRKWTDRLTCIPLMAMTMEGDQEYPLYQNIMNNYNNDDNDNEKNDDDDDDDFWKELFTVLRKVEEEEYDSITQTTSVAPLLPSIPQALERYFLHETTTMDSISSSSSLSPSSPSPDQELRLDDAFGVHYNMEQFYTHGDSHYDPSDITINICLDKDISTQGSHVLFHGTKRLHNVVRKDAATTTVAPQPQSPSSPSSPPPVLSSFLVEQIPGTATIHYGDHLHETTTLLRGSRTNIILTFWYTKRPSNVATRTCYDSNTKPTTTKTSLNSF